MMVLEYVDGGSLEQPLNETGKGWIPIPEVIVQKHFREVCKVRSLTESILTIQNLQ